MSHAVPAPHDLVTIRELRDAIAIVLPERRGAAIAAKMIKAVYADAKIDDVVYTIRCISADSFQRTSNEINDLWDELTTQKDVRK